MSDSKSSERKRKKSQYQWQGNKKGKQSAKKFELQAGMTGFLATLNDKQEKQATSELLNILPDFLPTSASEAAPSDGLAKGGDDIAAMLAAENATASLLQFCDTRVPNIIFVRLPPEQAKKVDANSVVSKVYESVEGGSSETPRQISRYVLRLLPVSASCPAYLDRINKSLKEAIESFIGALQPGELEGFSFFNLAFKATYNQSIKAQEVEDILICHMANLAPSIRFSRPAREHVLVVNVYIVRTVCCIGFCRDYYKFAKYNLSEFQAKQFTQTDEKVETEKQESS